MNRTRFTKMISMFLVMVLIATMLPVTSLAATAGNEENVIFFATDRHEETSKLQSLLKALAYTPGLVVLGGDHVNNTNSGSLASITSEIQSVYPGVQTFYTYAAHDKNVSADSSNSYAYARTGEVYEGNDYYVYAIDQDHMQSSSSASSAAADFVSWADGITDGKVIFVICHMPIHSRRGDNAGGATWMTALNEAGEDHDIVFLWGHNHTGESSADTNVYFVARGGSITPQGGSTGTINFTYMNAGYIKNGYASMMVVNSDCVDVTRYSTSGSATATYEIERLFAQTHTWEVTESVAATCDTDGYQTSVCTDCGETKTTVIAAIGHNYTSEVKDLCTGSFTVYTCQTCGYSYSEQNATETTYDKASSLTEGESYVIVASNYALTYGSSAGKTSVSASNGSITSDVTEAMIWTYENGMLSNNSSGTTYYINVSSSSSGSSNRPGSSSSSRTITFSTSGATVSYSSSKLKLGSYYLYYSSNSGFSARSSGSTVTLYQVNEVVGSTGEHSYESTTVAPTCTTDGSVTYTCTVCGDTYSEVIEATGSHSYETVTVDATCETAGSVTYTCTACGDSYSETVAALGHNYNAVVTAPTCTEGGYTTYTCAACGDSYTADKVAALGHSYEAVTEEATCENGGTVTYTCACGDTYTETIPALGHNYKAVVTAPTCETVGYTTYTCATCGGSYVADEVAALGHSYNAVVTAPTCETAGYTTYTCATCGYSYVADKVAALGHNHEAVVTAPTCETTGYTTYTCTTCGDSYVADETAALGHNYVCEEVDDFLVYTCSNCGSSYSEKVVTEITYDKSGSFTNGNQYVITIYSSRKYYALCHVDGELTAVQISANGQVSSEVTEDMLWTYEDGKLFYEEDGTTYYLYASTSGWGGWFGSATLKLSTSNYSTCSISSNKLKIGSYYLRYSWGGFGLNRSAGTAYLYVKNET